MTTLGFIILFISLSILILDPILEKLSVNWKTPFDLFDNNRKWILISSCVVGLMLILNPFVHNNAGERTYVQDPYFGTENIIFDPGYHWGGFFCRTQNWPDVMSTVFDKKFGTVPIRFNDATQGEATANIRWELPKDEQSMISLHKAYRNPESLQDRTLIPYGKECLAFSAQLMESETHYSGGQSKLKEDFRDQLLNGQYVLETKVEYRTDEATKEQIKITDVDLRRDENGRPITIPSDVQTYGIKAVFAAVPHVDYEPIVDKKLQAKIDQSTRESIAKQELITAQQQALTEKAKGEQLIAQTRANQEASKLEAVIKAEKEKLVAQENALKAKFTADKIEQEGRAQAAANKALVAAGLTPEQQMKLDIEIAKVVSENIAKASTPSVVIMGGNSSGSADEVMKIFGAERSLELIKKMKSNNEK